MITVLFSALLNGTATTISLDWSVTDNDDAVLEILQSSACHDLLVNISIF